MNASHPKRTAIILSSVVAAAGLAWLWPMFLWGQAGRGDAAAGIDVGQVPAGTLELQLEFLSQREGGKGVPTKWDGGLSVSEGRVAAIVLERPGLGPRRIEGTSWQASTRRKVPESSHERERGAENMPMLPETVRVSLEGAGPGTRIAVETAQGSFDFTLGEVTLGGGKSFLKGLAKVSRVPSSATIVSAPTEDDFPSAAVGPDGSLFVAWTAFTHGKGFERRMEAEEEPKSFDALDDPTGGDQVFLMRREGGTWGEPLPVTGPNRDVYRTALAVDGEGRAWVFWPEGEGGRWDLRARGWKDGKWGAVLKLSDDATPDAFPAAATDASGRAWVAWQGVRDGKHVILARRQEGERFGEAMTVSGPGANSWAPAVAASGDGAVAIAWDTYQKGDYDVCARVWRGAGFGDPVAVAAALRAEMRPSVAFDAKGRLWVAYEDGPENWGKDQGYLVKDEGGSRLLGGRSVAVRVLADGQLMAPVGVPARAISGGGQAAAEGKGKGKKGKASGAGRGQVMAAPRIAIDGTGRVWLTARYAPSGLPRSAVGTIHMNGLAWYEGGEWSDGIECPDTDNTLDQRPVLVPRDQGGVWVIAAGDGRRKAPRQARSSKFLQKVAALEHKWPDPVNSEITLTVVEPGFVGAAQAPVLEAVADAAPANPAPACAKEAEAVARMRGARVEVGGKVLRAFRGEFHRHTEISWDGGGDGMLMDMWRYARDAADFDWIGNGDHDNGGGREYPWWITQKTTEMFRVPGLFEPVFSYERSCSYPDGHRNVMFAQRGVRTLPRMAGGMGKDMDKQGADAERPNTPDTQMLYRYLREFRGVCSSHTSGTQMGTDWRDSDPQVEPFVEIYQGARQNYEMPGAPRSNTADDSQGGWRPLGFVSRALDMGIRMAFQSSSDHGSTHISYCVFWVEEPTRDAMLDAARKRRVYGATDNILAEFFCEGHFMGEEFSLDKRPTFKVRLAGTAPFAKVYVIKDGKYAYTRECSEPEVAFEWTDAEAKPGSTSYYYVRGEQADGELVWASPMWITIGG